MLLLLLLVVEISWAVTHKTVKRLVSPMDVAACFISFCYGWILVRWGGREGDGQDTFGPLLRGAAELRIRRDRWTFGGELGSCGDCLV